MRLLIVLIHQEFIAICSPNENKLEKKHAINSKCFATKTKHLMFVLIKPFH
jgi:hypothetical protein